MVAKKSPPSSPDRLDANEHAAVDKNMRPSRSGRAAIRKAVKQGKQAEVEGEKEVLEDLSQIDANFSRSRGRIISDWRVFNELSPFDVEAWDTKYAVEEKKALERGVMPKTYWRDRKLLLPSSNIPPVFRKGRAMDWNSLYRDPKGAEDEKKEALSLKTSLKRKEIPNSSDDESEDGPATKKLRA